MVRVLQIALTVTIFLWKYVIDLVCDLIDCILTLTIWENFNWLFQVINWFQFGDWIFYS